MIDHNERAAEARALRQAAADARTMHDPVAQDCEEWAAWLDARADRVLSGATRVTDSSDGSGPSVQSPTREQIVDALYRAGGGRPPGELGRIWRLKCERQADAVLALFPQPTPDAEPPLVQVGGRRGGKTSVAIDALLDRASERGIQVQLIDPAAEPKQTCGVCGRKYPASNSRATCPVCWPGFGEYATPCVCAPGSPDYDGPRIDCPVHGLPPSIADMAPGTTFTANEGNRYMRTAPDFLGRPGDAVDVVGWFYQAHQFDPSTVRDVTPPPATPEEGD